MVSEVCTEGQKTDDLLQELVTVSYSYFTVLLLAKINTVFSGYNERNIIENMDCQKDYIMETQLLKFCCILRVVKRKAQETLNWPVSSKIEVGSKEKH